MRVVSHDCAIFLGIPLILDPTFTILIHSGTLASSPTFKLPVTLNITRNYSGNWEVGLCMRSREASVVVMVDDVELLPSCAALPPWVLALNDH